MGVVTVGDGDVHLVIEANNIVHLDFGKGAVR